MGDGVESKLTEMTKDQMPSGPASSSGIEALVREHSTWMLRLCQRLLGDRALAEDGVQEALISAFRNLPQLENPAALNAWLYRVTFNQCLAMLRKRGKIEEELPNSFLPEFDRSGCRVEPLWTHFESPEELLNKEEKRTLVLGMIASLPDKYRMVLLLRDIEELSTTETAELLGINEANVKVRLHRARNALKQLLEPIMRGEQP